MTNERRKWWTSKGDDWCPECGSQYMSTVKGDDYFPVTELLPGDVVLSREEAQELRDLIEYGPRDRFDKSNAYKLLSGGGS